MATWTDSIPINLGTGNAGLTDLRARRKNVTTGANIGAEIASDQFLEDGSGNYSLIPQTFDDANGTQQKVIIYRAGQSATPLASTIVSAPVSEAGGGSVDEAAIAAAVATALAGNSSINVYNPIVGNTMTLVRGDAYSNTDGTGRRITVTKDASETSGWPTTLSTVHFYAKPSTKTLERYPTAASLADVACTIVHATDSGATLQSFYLELTSAQMATLTAYGSGGYVFSFIANKATGSPVRPATVRAGVVTVVDTPRTVA